MDIQNAIYAVGLQKVQQETEIHSKRRRGNKRRGGSASRAGKIDTARLL